MNRWFVESNWFVVNGGSWWNCFLTKENVPPVICIFDNGMLLRIDIAWWLLNKNFLATWRHRVSAPPLLASKVSLSGCKASLGHCSTLFMMVVDWCHVVKGVMLGCKYIMDINGLLDISLASPMFMVVIIKSGDVWFWLSFVTHHMALNDAIWSFGYLMWWLWSLYGGSDCSGKTCDVTCTRGNPSAVVHDELLGKCSDDQVND